MQQNIYERLTQFEEDEKWISENYENLKQEFPDEYIAVFQKKVIDHDKDISRLSARLKANYPEKSKHIAVEFIGTKDIDMIL